MVASNTIERIQWEQKRVQKELTMINVAARAWSIFDGAMMGYKLFQRFGKATRGFSRGKRKK